IRAQQQKIANDLAAPQVIAGERSRVHEELRAHEAKAEREWLALELTPNTSISKPLSINDNGLGSTFPKRLDDAARISHNALGEDAEGKQKVVTFIKQFHADRKTILMRSQDRLKAYNALLSTTTTPK
ncbi:MAG: hypothetical protein O7G83_12690, partial [Proteobacteria bacterium]|nr:hypothetical protein [Pseudomonadota bacterium]